MESIFAEITAERAHQDAQWGGAAHDDQHRTRDWAAFEAVYVGQSADWRVTDTNFRAAQVKLAALAVAAIEAIDREQERLTRD